MKLILTQEVAGLGAPGDVVEVKDGYGRNYLLPRGFAIAWTRGGEKQVTQIKRARKVREVRDLSLHERQEEEGVILDDVIDHIDHDHQLEDRFAEFQEGTDGAEITHTLQRTQSG